MTGRGPHWRAALLAAAAALALLCTEAAAQPYTTIEWLQPQPGQTLHDNRGNVRVELELAPPLQLRAGHRLQLTLDGKPFPELWSSQSGVLSGVDRGEHRLQAHVVAGDGSRIASSEPLVFHLWQASRLLPQRVR